MAADQEHGLTRTSQRNSGTERGAGVTEDHHVVDPARVRFTFHLCTTYRTTPPPAIDPKSDMLEKRLECRKPAFEHLSLAYRLCTVSFIHETRGGWYSSYLMSLFLDVYSPGQPINDHTLIHDGSIWHLFHIWLPPGITCPRKPGTNVAAAYASDPRDRVIGHATSRDLLTWDTLPDILPKTDARWETCPGANAPFVVKDRESYVLFYSRYCNQDGVPFNIQQIGRATSDDLIHWEEDPENPVFHPGDFWCPWKERSGDFFRPACCRDPHVIRYGPGWLLFYVAMTREPRVCAVAVASSEDLRNWTDCGPVFTAPITDHGSEMIESPCVLFRDGQWHLFFTHGRQSFWTVGGTPFCFANPVSLGEIHAPEIFEWEGRWVITHCGHDGGLSLAELRWGDVPEVIPFVR